ncbi:MAG: peptide deformylase [Cyclobacteriaceae bacterium]|nr:peptide deformylase [Cyclobacteriaceae bacterium]
MIYPIVVYGDPVLRQRAKDIEKGSDITQLIADMHETMQAAHGIGLAAPQIGKSLRLFVVDATTLEPEEGEEEEAEDLSDFKKAFINPQIIEESGEPWAFEEGCLSIPNLRENVARKETVRIKYYNENWELKEEVYDGMKARIIQHEYDHIEGKLFIDYLSPFKKRLLKGKLADITKGKVNTDYRITIPK